MTHVRPRMFISSLFRLTALAAALSLGGTGALQNTSGPDGEAEVAFRTVVSLLPSMQCETPEVWTVSGSTQAAARSLLQKLAERGWQVMEHGPAGGAYAVIADPDPNDPAAVAVGGLTLRPSQQGRNAVFLARCAVENASDENEVFTLLPSVGPSWA